MEWGRFNAIKSRVVINIKYFQALMLRLLMHMLKFMDMRYPMKLMAIFMWTKLYTCLCRKRTWSSIPFFFFLTYGSFVKLKFYIQQHSAHQHLSLEKWSKTLHSNWDISLPMCLYISYFLWDWGEGRGSILLTLRILVNHFD